MAFPHNEWPDPQFCIQDANAIVSMLNDEMTGTLNQISVTSYTTGSRTVTAYTASTGQLAAGDLIYFNAPADLALRQSPFRVTSVVTNTSFTFTIEYKDGVPTTSAACLVNQMQRGDLNGSAGGQVTSNVKKFADGTSWPAVWISARAAHVGLLKGCRRVLVVRKATASDEYIYWEPTGERLTAIRGTGRACGVAVYVANGSGASARAYCLDSAGRTLSSGTATGATRTWMSAQKTAALSTTTWQEGVVLSGPVGATFVIGEFTSAPSGTEFGDGGFSTPRGQMVLSLSSISPWVGAKVKMPASGVPEFLSDMRQASSGVINEGVSYVMGLLEGQSNAEGNIFTTRSRPSAPTLYSPVLRAPVAVTDPFAGGVPTNYAFASGNFLLTDDATMVFYSNNNSAKWGFLSWDIHGALLYATS